MYAFRGTGAPVPLPQCAVPPRAPAQMSADDTVVARRSATEAAGSRPSETSIPVAESTRGFSGRSSTEGPRVPASLADLHFQNVNTHQQFADFGGRTQAKLMEAVAPQ